MGWTFYADVKRKGLERESKHQTVVEADETQVVLSE